jgi:FADH2 O2-dependent halogenase
MSADVDVAVIGSGFGGSLLAAIARRTGLSVALVERGRHPRFAIGESTSPLANILLEQLAARYDLPRLAPLASYGPWTRTYPEVRRGLKRGFTFFEQRRDEPFAARSDRANELLVAASPNDEVADTHWLRADVDAFFVAEAARAGVDVLDETELDRIEVPGGGRRSTLAGTRRGAGVRLTARLVVDASGPGGALARALGIPGARYEGFPSTRTLYSHFTGVARCDRMPEYATEGERPYPADDAALHHVFDGGWMWVLRFDDGTTSAGFMVDEALARETGFAEGAGAWGRMLDRYPTIGAQFADAEPIRPFVAGAPVTFRMRAAAGAGWAMLPSAAGFVDPLFSTGFPLTLLGVERLGRLFERHGAGDGLGEPLADYARTTLEELDHTARYVAACTRAFGRFPLFARYSMFYFAAASYAESARRVGRPERAARFLALDRPDVVAAMRSCGDAACQGVDPAELGRAVAAAVEPINVAGLCDEAKANWYGVDLDDLFTGAPKLGVDTDAIREALRAAGLLVA